jgi:hypothetical protein
MPRRANDKHEALQRRLARAKTSTEAKKRERKAKLENVGLRSEDTVRANMLERARIPVHQFEGFLRAFGPAYERKYPLPVEAKYGVPPDLGRRRRKT